MQRPEFANALEVGVRLYDHELARSAVDLERRSKQRQTQRRRDIYICEERSQRGGRRRTAVYVEREKECG